MKKNAFTLIELLVVVAIVGILAVIATSILQKRIGTVRANITFSNINQIGLEKAEELFEGNHIEYGLEHELFDPNDVDYEQEKYRTTQVKSALLGISSKGIENLSAEELEALRHAILEKKSHSKEEINELQERYERIRISKRDTKLKTLDPNHLSVESIFPR